MEETCLFQERPDKTITHAYLFYLPEEILSVRSYDRTVTYTEGTDCLINGNELSRLPGSRIPYLPLSHYCADPESHPDLAWLKLKEPYQGVLRTIGIE